MTLAERGVSQPTVSLAGLLSGHRESLTGSCGLRLADYVEEITASGFPAMRGLTGRAHRFQLDSYLHNAVDRDVPEQGLAVRKPDAMLNWLRAYAAASGHEVPYQVMPRRPGDIAACYADPTAARELLGWSARHDLARMCADSWRWQSTNPKGFQE